MATRGNFSVRLEKGESVDSLITRFIKKTKKENLLDEILNRKNYKKPSVKKREKHRLALKNAKRKNKR